MIHRLGISSILFFVLISALTAGCWDQSDEFGPPPGLDLTKKYFSNDDDIGDFVWLDANSNGIQDEGEKGLPGADVFLFCGDSTTSITNQTTDSEGHYLFKNVGKYCDDSARVRVTFESLGLDNVYEFTKKDQEETDLLDSDANQSPEGKKGETDPITADMITGDEENDLKWDFGVLSPEVTGNGTVLDDLTGGILDPFEEVESEWYQITGLVWHDQEEYGIQEVGERPAEGVVVKLFVSSPDYQQGQSQYVSFREIASAVTDSGGRYLIDTSPYLEEYAGRTAFLLFVPTIMDGFTLQNAGPDEIDSDVFNIARLYGRSPEFILGNEFGPIDAGLVISIFTQLRGRVWLDKNSNGIQDTGEEGLSGISLQLDHENIFFPVTVYTDKNGDYIFGDLNSLILHSPSQYYNIQIILPPGYYLTRLDVGDDTLDSDFPPDSGKVSVVGSISKTYDAGLIHRALMVESSGADPPTATPTPTPSDTPTPSETPTSTETPINTPTPTPKSIVGEVSIGDRVWHDINQNGIQNGGEPGVPNVAVLVWEYPDIGGPPILERITNIHGVYQLSGIPPGEYIIKFSPPVQYVFTRPNQGDDDSKDSDVIQRLGVVGDVQYTAKGRDDTVDAGLILQAQLFTPTPIPVNGNVNVTKASCRHGPSQAFLDKYTLHQGHFVDIVARFLGWLLVRPTNFAGPCWIYSGLLDINGDVSILYEYEYLSYLPREYNFAPTPSGIVTERNNGTVTISWADAQIPTHDSRGYLFDLYVCREGRMVRYFVQTTSTSITVEVDKDCDETSMVLFHFVVHKDGYSEYQTYPLP